METFAYLHTACAYDDPEASELTLNLEQLNIKHLSSQASLLMLQLLVPVAILTVAGHASALEVLQVGDRGASVTTLQDRLRDAGYFNRSSTGVYSSITEASVRRFQAARGLTVDGIAGPATQRALSNQTASSSGNYYQNISYSGGLRLGSSGSQVSALQQRLKDLGYDIDVDGVFGSATDRAVRQFQSSNRLGVDGIVGAATQDALANGVKASNPNLPVDPGVPSGGSGGYIYPGNNRPTTSIGKRYVVVVPVKNSSTFTQIYREFPDARLAKSNLGAFVQAGSFGERKIAEARSLLLRAKGFDAQVRYL